jgi:hypothetical protein
MSPESEQYERLKHQATFLHERELMSQEMKDGNRQLWLLERLSGNPSKLDPTLRDRLHGELEQATAEQLKATGLMDEWLASWEARNAPATPTLPAEPTFSAPSAPAIPVR